MPEEYRTVETGIFYVSRLKGNGEGWGVEGATGREGRRGKDYRDRFSVIG